MNKWITIKNIALVILALGVLILLLTRPGTKEVKDMETMLQEQQKTLQRLAEGFQRNTEEDLRRDSVLREQLAKNDKDREQKIIYINQSKDEKIKRINSADFTRDSIRRAFAE
jgi:uncharacterized protein YoxC